MGFIDITKKILNQTLTENEGISYRSTGSACLDYFSLVGGLRFNPFDGLYLFNKSFKENPLITLKILFYVRDIRNGLGERDLFRLPFLYLANNFPLIAKQLLKYIPQIGRWDDIFYAYNSPLKDDIVDMVKGQLLIDLINKEKNQPISLLAKWMPSINTSSDEIRYLAIRLSKDLNLSKKVYRNILSYLRKDLIIENNLRTKNYTFDYSKVPGNALFKYQKAFLNNDYNRYNSFLTDVSYNKAKMNSQVIYPYEIIRKFDDIVMYGRPIPLEELNSLNVIWDTFSDSEIASKTIVVRDGSFSMYDGQTPTAQSVATSLTMLFASRLTGPFKNKFITFSKEPELITITGNTAFEKYNSIVKYNKAQNTDIKKVYDLILDVYKHQEFKEEDSLDRIVIISDMEFDEVESYNDTTYQYFKDEFDHIGYKIPEIVFWNVRSRHIHFPATKDNLNIKFVSGASKLIIDSITKNDSLTPYDYMLDCLKQYDYLDTINLKKINNQ